jgi:outer membrane receptor protein involved in Fe transport
MLMQYTRPFIAEAQLTMTVAYSYRSEFTGNTTSPAEAAVKSLPGYGVMNASATLLSANGPWKVNVWVKNVLDRTYRTRAKDDGVNSYVDFFGEPRSAGLTLSYVFD